MKNKLDKVYVFSKRIMCAKNGDFDKYSSSAIAYGWFIFTNEKNLNPTIRWIL